MSNIYKYINRVFIINLFVFNAYNTKARDLTYRQTFIVAED